MPLKIPQSMKEEHRELHRELVKTINLGGKVGLAAREVAKTMHPHMERENKLALPVISVTRELAEGKMPSDLSDAFDLSIKFKSEHKRLLQEHARIVKTLNKLERAATAAKMRNVVLLAKRLKHHVQTEEELTYSAVLMAARLLSR
jgi:hypothetical protein